MKKVVALISALCVVVSTLSSCTPADNTSSPIDLNSDFGTVSDLYNSQEDEYADEYEDEQVEDDQEGQEEEQLDVDDGEEQEQEDDSEEETSSSATSSSATSSSATSSTATSSSATSSSATSSSAISSSATSSSATSSSATSSTATSSSVTSSTATSSTATSSSATSSTATSSVVATSTTSSSGTYVPSSTSTMKAVWISYLEFDSFVNSSETQFTSKMINYYSVAKEKGLNTVIVQLRPHGDAMYPSDVYPWSKHVSGTMGTGVSYDPLEIMIDLAHSMGLEFHAWINPYRTMTDAEFALIDNSYLTKQWFVSSNRSDYMIKSASDSRWWLNPSNDEVRQLISDGVAEIVRNYDVDGIHIDDYFYVSDPVNYGDNSTTAKLYTTMMVKGLYDTIKAIDRSVQFGVSPAGSINHPDTTPNSDLSYLSTNIALWCSNDGYIDYIMPQIYWGYDHSTQPFTKTYEAWQSLVTASNVELIIGLAPYQNSATVINQQRTDVENNGDGYALFRFDFIGGL